MKIASRTYARVRISEPMEPASIPQAFETAVRRQRAGLMREAEGVYRDILATRPDIVEVRNELGANLLAQGRRDDAEAEFRAALALRPGYAEARCNLGNVLWQSGDLDGAVA